MDAAEGDLSARHDSGRCATLLCVPATLIVPTLAAGLFHLRPFTLADTDAVREASSDPHIPLITTVPAAFAEDGGRRFIERQWSRAERIRRILGRPFSTRPPGGRPCSASACPVGAS